MPSGRWRSGLARAGGARPHQQFRGAKPWESRGAKHPIGLGGVVPLAASEVRSEDRHGEDMNRNPAPLPAAVRHRITLASGVIHCSVTVAALLFPEGGKPAELLAGVAALALMLHLVALVGLAMSPGEEGPVESTARFHRSGGELLAQAVVALGLYWTAGIVAPGLAGHEEQIATTAFCVISLVRTFATRNTRP